MDTIRPERPRELQDALRRLSRKGSVQVVALLAVPTLAFCAVAAIAAWSGQARQDGCSSLFVVLTLADLADHELQGADYRVHPLHAAASPWRTSAAGAVAGSSGSAVSADRRIVTGTSGSWKASWTNWNGRPATPSAGGWSGCCPSCRGLSRW
ncbi:hypothetical protein [Streptomyces sp. YIM 98790]|uniref:hypothetical protein n=1 Tax=Streptomyces sp. YIM 98790 TaxID=2689077 RepID=UPI00140B2C83|nr:hypothetical protein [Streptomyces sp. YIM 98790]